MTQLRKTALPAGLYALAVGGFGIGLTEFGIVGLLSEIADEYAVSEAAAGYLVSGYALAVAIGAILVAAMSAGVNRKRVLLGLVLLFVAGNVVSAIAPTFGWMLLGRVVAAICHGGFFSVGAVVATSLVPEARKASAISVMFAGLTVANVLGVPFGTYVGQQLGWRATFAAISAIGVCTYLGIQLLVGTPPRGTQSSVRSELVALRRPQIWVSALVSILAFGSVVGAFGYISFTLTEVSGFRSGDLPWLLLLFGVGTFVGNIIGGRLADRALDPALLAILAALALVLVGFALSASIWWVVVIAMFGLGTVGFATAPGLQLRMMRAAAHAPTVASGVNIAALNAGNAIGVFVAGMAIQMGYGFTAPLWIGSLFAAAALLVLVVSVAAARRAPASVPGTGAIPAEL